MPAALHAYAAERLVSARTAEDVRAVFTDVREREHLATQATHLRVTTGGAQHTGAMIAFMLPRAAADRLSEQAGVTEPASELHVTLAYLGEAADWTPQQVQRLRKSLAGWASEQMAVPVLIGGPNNGPKTFPKSAEMPTGEHPIYAPVASERIQTFRAALVRRLTADGLPFDTTHREYVPHVTLAWVPDDTDNLLAVADLPSVPIIFDTLTLAMGDDRYAIALGPRADAPETPEMPVTRHVPVAAVPVAAPVAAAGDDPLQRLADALARRVELSTAEQMRELRTQVLAAIS